jgi:hypothetical protein
MDCASLMATRANWHELLHGLLDASRIRAGQLEGLHPFLVLPAFDLEADIVAVHRPLGLRRSRDRAGNGIRIVGPAPG